MCDCKNYYCCKFDKDYPNNCSVKCIGFTEVCESRILFEKDNPVSAPSGGCVASSVAMSPVGAGTEEGVGIKNTERWKRDYVLLLASYCDKDECSDHAPCLECLKICNIALVDRKNKKVFGGYKFMKEKHF